jgi:hypothetical protein
MTDDRRDDELRPEDARFVAVLSRFVRRRGWDALDIGTRAAGIAIYAKTTRCRHMQRRGLLAPALAAALETIPGFEWEPLRQRYRRKIDLVRKLVRKVGWVGIDYRTTIEGAPIGTWMNEVRQRHSLGVLDPWAAYQLESIPGWTWEYSWEAGRDRIRNRKTHQHLNALREHLRAGHAALPGKRAIVAGRRVGLAVGYFRRRMRDGDLPEEILRELARMPGWKAPDDRHQRLRTQESTARHLEVFRRHARAVAERRSGRRRIGRGRKVDEAVAYFKRRHSQGQLSESISDEVRRMPGCTLRSRSDNEDEHVRLLHKLAGEQGLPKITSTLAVDGVQIGYWVRNVIHQYRRGRLPEPLQRKVEAVRGWYWPATRNEEQRRSVRILAEYLEDHDWSDLAHAGRVKGVHLESWVNSHRYRYKLGKLSDWMIREIERIPGFTWYPREERSLPWRGRREPDRAGRAPATAGRSAARESRQRTRTGSA